MVESKCSLKSHNLDFRICANEGCSSICNFDYVKCEATTEFRRNKYLLEKKDEKLK